MPGHIRHTVHGWVHDSETLAVANVLFYGTFSWFIYSISILVYVFVYIKVLSSFYIQCNNTNYKKKPNEIITICKA